MSACPTLETDLSLDEAHGILAPFFEEVRSDFLKHGFLLVKEVKFFVAPEMHDTPRHFAACSENGKKILVAPELAELDYAFVIGIMAHEFGHATDFLYPGEFFLGRDGTERRRRDDVSEGQWIRWTKTWENRPYDVVEKTADGIAEKVWGSPIGYAGPCKLQNFRTGEARPQGLR